MRKRSIEMVATASCLLVAAALWGGMESNRVRRDQATRQLQAILSKSEPASKDEVEGILRRGADIRSRGNDGTTILHWAAAVGDPQVAAIAIESGVDVNGPQRDRFSPLMIAAYSHSEPVFKQLVAAGANVNARTDFGWSALDLCIREGHLNAVRLLLKSGADVNGHATGRAAGMTPLMCAAAYGDAGTVRLLLSSGADRHQRNMYGQDAAAIALERNQQSSQSAARDGEQHAGNDRERETSASIIVILT